MTAAEQLALDFAEIVTPEYEAEATLAERFAAFHEANPHVADALETLAEQWLARHRKVGMKSLAEQVRWASGMQTTGEPWRINNSHVAFYARLLIDRRPEWADCIETRAAQADRAAS